MAQVKISALTAADPLTGVEEAPFVQGGATKKATAEQIREYVASQPNVFSVTQRIEDAAPALQFSENDTVDQNWEFIGVAGALRLDELNDAFSTTGTHHTFTHGGGTQFGSPTGGDQGAGTVNAEGLYENGTGVAKLSGGADANFTAMPQVGGDPIVESGSNADGEFTRWADGTQNVRGSISRSIDFTTAAGSFFRNTSLSAEITLPASFSGTVTDYQADVVAGGESYNSDADIIIGTQQVENENQSLIRPIIVTRSSSTITVRLTFFASGRWK